MVVHHRHHRSRSAKSPGSAQSPAPAKSKSPQVEVTIVFRDVLHKPIEGLDVQIKAGTGAPAAPAWITGPDKDENSNPSVPDGAPAPASAPGSASAPGGAPAPAAPPTPLIQNSLNATTDKDGYAATIHNAARNQPIDVLVKNHRGEYVLKATVTPSKDISAFTVVSPEYHLEAKTKLDSKGELQQDLNLPVVKAGEIMTVERLVKEFGPYIGWSQKVTEQGEVRKDYPVKHKEKTEDPKTHKKKTHITIEHHYRVVDTGKPKTIAFNVLGSRLNYPKTVEISEEKYREVARTLDCEVAAIKAVAATEASGSAFCINGLPKIRFERRYFYRASLPPDKRGDDVWLKQPNPFPKHPDLCLRKMGGYSLGRPKDFGGWPSQSDNEVAWQYERLVRASALNSDAAIMACSWGAFQVMAYFYKECGYASPSDLANSTMKGVDEQIDLFCKYVINVNKGALAALRKKDWVKFAYYYNGHSYNVAYPISMKNAYNKYR